MKYYFTFMQRQPFLKNRYLCIVGSSYRAAREMVFAAIGDQWAFQYSEEEWKDGVSEHFGDAITLERAKELL